MKKILFGTFVVAFLVCGLAGQSWAMGHRGHSSGSHYQGGSSGDQSNNYTGDNSQNDGANNDNPDHDNFVGDGTNGNTTDDRFPGAATVPEPATLALMGMGLTGIFLKRKKS